MALPKDLLAEQTAVEQLEQQLIELQNNEPAGDLLEMARHRETVERASAIVAERRDALNARITAHEAVEEQKRLEKRRQETLAKMRVAADHLRVMSTKFEAALDNLINVAASCGITIAGEGLLPPIPSVKEHSGGGWRFTNLPRQQQQQQTAYVPNSGTELLIQ